MLKFVVGWFCHGDRKKQSDFVGPFLEVVSILKWNKMSNCASDFSRFYVFVGWPSAHLTGEELNTV